MLRSTNVIQRIFLFAAALGLIKPGLITDTVGISVSIILFLWQRYQRNSENTIRPAISLDQNIER